MYRGVTPGMLMIPSEPQVSSRYGDMSPDPNKKTPRSFQCRESLWQKFEQMAKELECSVDYLINDAMKQYARQRGYSGTTRASEGNATQSAPAGAAHGRAPVDASQSSDTLGAVTTSGSGAHNLSAGSGAPPHPAHAAASPPPYQASAPPAVQPPPARPKTAPMHAPPPIPAVPPPAPPAPGAKRVVPGHGFGAPPPIPGVTSVMPPTPPPMPGRVAPPPPVVPSARVAAGTQAMGMPARTLTVLFQGQMSTINKDRFIIGRGKQTSDLTIKDPNVSRQHALIEFVNGQYYISDMGSTNGIEYQGQRVQRRAIVDGDVVKICDHELSFSYR